VYIGQNPPEAVKVTLYRWTGEKLERVDLPYTNDTSQVYWMDVWVDAAAPVRRIKLEPQLSVNGDWVTYPLEVRVSDPTAPNRAAEGARLESVFRGNSNQGSNPCLSAIKLQLFLAQVLKTGKNRYQASYSFVLPGGTRTVPLGSVPGVGPYGEDGTPITPIRL